MLTPLSTCSSSRKEFVQGYTQRALLLRRQDAEEQRRRLDCLLLLGPHVTREVVCSCSFIFTSFIWQAGQGSSSTVSLVCALISLKAEQEVPSLLLSPHLQVRPEDIEFVDLRSHDNRRSIFIRQLEVPAQPDICVAGSRAVT